MLSLLLLLFSLLLFVHSEGTTSGVNLGIYKEIPVEKIVKAAAYLRSDGVTEIQKHETICRMTYCHFDENTVCYSKCSILARDVDNAKWNALLLEPVRELRDRDDCVANCGIICRSPLCSDQCPSLCDYHFSFPNRLEYERELNHISSQL